MHPHLACREIAGMPDNEFIDFILYRVRLNNCLQDEILLKYSVCIYRRYYFHESPTSLNDDSFSKVNISIIGPTKDQDSK